jgi:hypothetical protein
MIAALAWLTGSRIGQYAALAALVAASVGLILWRTFRAGKSSAQAAQLQETINAFTSRVTSDNDLARMSAAERRQRLRQHWTIAE